MIALAALALAVQAGAARVDVAVDVNPSHALNRVVPMQAVGAGVDAENPGSVPTIYGRQDVAQMLAAGLGPVSYRLFTELGVQDWHWNPAGTWSDANASQGYFTGTTALGSPIVNSYGYALPERGFTFDQANDQGYSRIDDGDRATYWKSNPYLTQAYTFESDALHPQWFLFDLGARRGVDAVRIAWAAPYAVAYAVQYWTGPDALYDPSNGRWTTFPQGQINTGRGGEVTLRVANAPVSVRYVRVLMSTSSSTCDSHGAADPRNCRGYAVGEAGVGTLDGSGRFHDLVVHARSQRQTPAYVASVDPWHRPADRATGDVQPGLDAVFQSGLTRGIPALVPVSLLYGTPDDAVAEIRYLQLRNYALRGVELGEEPDGQFASPEDYGALYVQWAAKLRAIAPSLPLGGPVFEGSDGDVKTWPNAMGDASWLHRFLAYLSSHNAMASFDFMSFEHYPFNACTKDPYADLQNEPRLAARILQIWRADGVPANVPFYVTETNFSANASAVFQDLTGGLWFADMAGAFLSDGAGAVYLYQYAPEPMQRTSRVCNTWGSYGMFAGNPNYTVRQRTAQFFAGSLLMTQWAQPVNATHDVLPVRVSAGTGGSPSAISAYALLRPDGEVAVMLIDKDPTRRRTAVLAFSNGSQTYHFAGPVTQSVFGRAQYAWHGTGPNAFANPDGPASIRKVAPARRYDLAGGSITIVRGKLAAGP